MSEQMAETTMPTTEAQTAEAVETEQNSYECAFHILPTVVEEEVLGVFETLKAHITKAGGEIFSEEAPERVDLAYEIVKQSDGKNKRYGSAYFGWVRFRVTPDKIDALKEEIDADPSILRYLLIKLTKVEEARPFRYHEQRKADKMVTVVDEEAGDVLADPLSKSEEPKSSESSEPEASEAEEAEQKPKTENAETGNTETDSDAETK